MHNLPSLVVDITGDVSTNLPAYRNSLSTFLQGINTTLDADEDFIRAEDDIKFCKATEGMLQQSTEAAFSKAGKVRECVEALGQMKETVRAMRLRLERLVKTEKERRKNDMVDSAVNTINEHKHQIEINMEYKLPHENYRSNLLEAVKGKKAHNTMQVALDDAVNRLVSQDNDRCATMSINLAVLDTHKSEYGFLFTDFENYIHDDISNVKMMIENRILKYKAKQAEDKRLEEEKEKEFIQEPEVSDDVLTEEGLLNVVKEMSGELVDDSHVIGELRITTADLNRTLSSIIFPHSLKDVNYILTLREAS